jgi:Spy/CpxP family protein refolding chaperone
MKGKFVSALVGIGAAALLAVPGAASASTTHAQPTKSEWFGNSCAWRPVPWNLRGRFEWVQEGWGWNARCVLVPIWGGGGFRHGGGFGNGFGNHNGFGDRNGHNSRDDQNIKIAL